jgi:Protein of unknown function (DUF3995)
MLTTLRPTFSESAMKHFRMILGDAGAAVLAGVSVLHVYWAAGGRRGQHAVVPTSGGRPLMAPSTAATVAVAAASATASTLYLGATARWQPRWVYRVGARGAATVLVARAIGDRRYVGFLKRSRDSPFARRDTYLYSPLCTLLAVAGAAAAA